jgi:germination protein M
MKNVPWWVWVVGVLVIALAVLGGVLIGRMSAEDTAGPGDEATTTVEPTSSVEPTPTLPGDDGSDDATTDTTKPQYVRVYFARGDRLGVALRQIPPTKAVASAAMQELLLGNSSAEQGYGLSTEVPVGTRLGGVTIKSGTATVNLNREFESGGGTHSMMMRLAQVVFTLTQFNTVDDVVLLIDGEKVDVFSSEGLVLADTQKRSDFEAVLPAIFVEGPTPGATVASPVRVWGTANTFEATFMIKILDPDGDVIYDKFTTATSGSGTRGTFEVKVPFTTPKSGMGALVVYEQSAMDGSPINVVEIPVKMLK